jgi:hypothetical protein
MADDQDPNSADSPDAAAAQDAAAAPVPDEAAAPVPDEAAAPAPDEAAASAVADPAAAPAVEAAAPVVTAPPAPLQAGSTAPAPAATPVPVPPAIPNPAAGRDGGGGGFGALAVVAILLLVAAETVLAWQGHRQPGLAAPAWAAALLLILAFTIFTGYAINSQPAGLLIDNRNRVSLSKFQALCWTILVVSALATVAAARIAHGGLDAADIDIPGELLAALGISATSLVATPALLSLKSGGTPPTAQEVAKTADKLDMDSFQINPTGRVFSRLRADGARWLDMFRGEDVSNAGSPDLSKIQQFLLTLILLGVYAAALLQMFLDAGPGNPLLFGRTARLPSLSPNFIWLMGISHASYLAYKAVPHGPPPGPPAT